MDSLPVLSWIEDGRSQTARWQSEAGLPPPSTVIVADDRMPADRALQLMRKRTALLWRGDYHNARHLLDAVSRRIEQRGAGGKRGLPAPAAATPLQAFEAHRAQAARRARILGLLLLPFEAAHRLPLRRAPDVRQACDEAHGPASEPYVMPMRELLGIIGAHEWRKKGVAVAALGGAPIHPHYGVFAPIRSEYVDLVARAPLPAGTALAFDIGTGTGVLAALLARRGVERTVATDTDPRAVACANDNVERLGLGKQIQIALQAYFPDGRANLVVCNPPWLPGHPSASLERAVFDPDSTMLRGFLTGLRDHLAPGGEGWLILSDFAERLGLRSRASLETWIRDAHLVVAGRLDAKPRHPKAADASDPLFAVRAAEIVSLWRLVAADQDSNGS